MITEGRLEPFIIVFIDPLDRMKEYWANDAFADWMARTLVPLVDGYIYKMTLTAKSGNQPPAYGVNADPQKPTGLTATGSRFFYIGSDVGTPTSNNEKPAGPDDPPAGGG